MDRRGGTMAFVIGAGIVWLALFAILQWAMKYDAEHAAVFAQPIDSVKTIDEVVTESLEPQQDRRAG
jgi:hypothetical protein